MGLFSYVGQKKGSTQSVQVFDTTDGIRKKALMVRGELKDVSEYLLSDSMRENFTEDIIRTIESHYIKTVISRMKGEI